jgi:hypothetical protein
MTVDERDRLQRAYNAMCSAESSLDGLVAAQFVRGRLAEIRSELGRIAFPTPVTDG